MSNLQYGLKEVANVVFFEVGTLKPVLFFDTLKVSTIENESESAEARGGQGNSKLLSWDFGRTATLTMQDALLSDASLAMLAGTEVQKTGIKAIEREVLTVEDGKVTLKSEPTSSNTLSIRKVENGIMGDEISTFTLAVKEVTIASDVVDGEQVMAIYEYDVTDVNATQVTFSGNKFPATYTVVGDTIVRGRDGVDRKMQFYIPKAKLQSTFNLTMDVENVSVFDFNLDILLEAGTNKLYEIRRLG